MQAQIVQSKIYEIRGQRVILDFDLAALYGVETRVLNQAVKRNIERFPADFMFQLTKGELAILKSQTLLSNPAAIQGDVNLKSQIVTSSWGGLRKLPNAFTEQGVAMLSSVLRSPLAIQVNIGIMRAFVQLRHAMLRPMPDNYNELKAEIQSVREEINDILGNQNDINETIWAQLDAISEALAEMQVKETIRKPRRRIGFIQDNDD